MEQTTIAPELSPLEIARANSVNEAESKLTRRQWVAIINWLASGMMGTIEWPTGVGKTRIGIEVIKLLRRTDKTRLVLIVVPTLLLKDQWESELRSANQLEYTQVWVINGLVNLPDYGLTAKLIIMDEIHHYAAETFSRVFKVVLYNWPLGLTATLSRMDGKHALLKEKAPIVDVMTMAYARREGFLSQYRVYNLGISLDEKDAAEYDAIHSKFSIIFGRFGQNLDVMRKCCFGLEPRFYSSTGTFLKPYVVQYAERLGWRGNSAMEAFQAIRAGTPKTRAWGNEDHRNSPANLSSLANAGMAMMRKRKDFINKYPLKVDIAARIIETFKVKTVTFGESISQAEELAAKLGSTARVYHSEVKATERNTLEEKEYRTEQGASRWIAAHPEWVINHKRGKIYVQRHVMKKVSGAKLKREALHAVMNYQSVMVLCTARAVDEGLNFPGAQLGIIYSRTQNPRQTIQRMGRIVRRHILEDGTEKEGLIVHIYLKDTKEEDWLKKAQIKSLGAIWVNSIEEIVSHERSQAAKGNNVFVE